MNLENKTDFCYLSDEELKEFIERTSFLGSEKKYFSLRKNCIINNITSFPKCPVCNNDTAINRSQFRQFCSNNCRKSNIGQKIMSEKRSATNIKIYGFNTPSKSEIVKQNTIETNREIYGTDWGFQSELVKNKIGDTFEKNHGVRQILSSKKIRQQIEDTCNKKYNVKNVSQADYVKNKRDLTFKEKYNGNPFSNEIIQNKIKQTNLKKYDSEYIFSSEHFKIKHKENSNIKYGTDFPSQNEEIKNNIKRIKRHNYWYLFNKLLKFKDIEPLFNKEYYCNLENKEFKYKCLSCKKEFTSEAFSVQSVRCPCHKYKSKPEFVIRQFLDNLKIYYEGGKRYYYDKKRFFEIDIYIPEFNIGIEHDGLFHHCDINKHKDYHINKTLFFKEKNISIIHIFGNELENKKQIVESIIKSKINKIENKIYARECEIKEVESNISNEFLIFNHLQGKCNSKIKIGLFYNNELIQLLTFGKSRYNKNYEYELLRSCSKLNTIVVGGFDKLLKYFEKTYNPKSLITYSDLRYFNGNSYLKSGFEFSHRSSPDYFYFKRSMCSMLFHRTEFQKHKLALKLNKFDPNKTEYENMIDNDYLRIYDCGNNVFIKQY